MEQEHPIPQQISSYQFRLVGDMTLNQFFQVAGGALISLAIYSSNLPVYFKWPLIIFTFILGIAFAFFPLQDRPLATWIVLFLKAIYSPTIYVWKKGAEKRDFFVSDTSAGVSLQSSTAPQPNSANAIDKAQPASTAVKPETMTNLEAKEAEFLDKVEAQLANEFVVPPPVTSVPDTNPTLPTQQVSQKVEVAVPATQAVKVDVTSNEIKHTVEDNLKPKDLNESFVPNTGTQLSGIQTANFVPEASPPLPPTIANVIVGQVLDPNGKIIDNAILEILDTQGRPLRALKSNKLGHFMIVTPLANGIYNLVTEREGYNFDPVQIECNGQIVAPIAIIAKNVAG